MTAKPRLVLTRRLAAPPSAVFEAWTDPERARGWLGPSDWECTGIESDVRVGGRWQWTIRDRATGESRASSGVFREVVPNRKLVFTFTWDDGESLASECTVEFHARGGGTLMTFVQEPFSSDAERDGHATGWSEAFAKIERVVTRATQSAATH